MSVIALPRRRAWTRPALASRAARLLERDALAVLLVCAWAGLLALAMPKLFVQDTWLSLVDGRLIAQHGLPHADSLTVWTLGRPWTDQQWGAHLVLYGLAQAGGLRLVVAFGMLCVLTAIVIACVATRKLGATPGAAAFGALLPLLGSPWLTQVRSQSAALPLFVAVYALLAFDARNPGRRVLLVLPLLALWANLHGSVLMAAGLTSLYGLTLLRRSGHRLRASALVIGAPLCVLATPYGFSVVAYYRLMLVHSPLTHYVHEWQAPTVQKLTAGLFLSAFALVALWARHPRAVTSFERWAIVLLLLAAMTALRNAIWFELAAAITLPRLLDATWRPRPQNDAVRRLNLFLGLFAVAGVLVVLIAQFARPQSWLQRDLPPSAAAAIARAAGPSGLVLSDDVHADWLLWQQPSLAGRLAYDIRFELFSANELEQLKLLQEGGRAVWQRCGVANVVTFQTSAAMHRVARAGVLSADRRLVVDQPGLAAVAQAPKTGRCAL
jgi:hypothetical protein